MEVAWEQARLPDILQADLDVVFVGFNPGRRSAQRGRHFAGVNNHFWRLLHQAEFTPVCLTAAEDRTLLDYGLGITNIVDRPTKGTGDLQRGELWQGGAALAAKMAVYRPKILCLLGKDVYRAYAGLAASADVTWGVQRDKRLPGIIDFVAPNPSSRSTVPFALRLDMAQQLHSLVAQLRAAAP